MLNALELSLITYLEVVRQGTNSFSESEIEAYELHLMEGAHEFFAHSATHPIYENLEGCWFCVKCGFRPWEVSRLPDEWNPRKGNRWLTKSELEFLDANSSDKSEIAWALGHLYSTDHEWEVGDGDSVVSVCSICGTTIEDAREIGENLDFLDGPWRPVSPFD